MYYVHVKFSTKIMEMQREINTQFHTQEEMSRVDWGSSSGGRLFA
jgi:hypothetical protein